MEKAAANNLLCDGGLRNVGVVLCNTLGCFDCLCGQRNTGTAQQRILRIRSGHLLGYNIYMIGFSSMIFIRKQEL
ncbi:hypothetical protein OROMI_013310 [Orobanche minor]